jgi:hypothetical protein
MTQRNPEKMNKLIRQGALKRRAKEVTGRWAKLGVSVSPVSHEKYCLLIDRLRGGHSWPLQFTDRLSDELRTFVADRDMITIIGWNVDDEPALLVGPEALLRSGSRLTEVYPDGFILVDEIGRSALLVDVDEEMGAHTNRIELPSHA